MDDEAAKLLELIAEARAIAERQGRALVAYFLAMVVLDLEGEPDASPQPPQTPLSDRRRRVPVERQRR